MAFEPGTAPDEGDLARVSASVAALRTAQAVSGAGHAAEVRALADAYEVAEGQIARLMTQRSKDAEMAMRSIAAELAAASRLSDRSVLRQMERAATLVRKFPRTLDALAEGRITRTHVDAILRAGSGLFDDDALIVFESQVLPRAEALSPGRLETYATRLAEDLHPRSITTRHVEARETRCVSVTDAGDGMSDLRITAPTVLVHGIHDRVSQHARAIWEQRESGDTRTLDQIRSDVACDLLLTTTPTGENPTGLAAVHAIVQVSVPATTLTGESDTGAEITGGAPIDAGTIRVLAGNAPGWDRVFRDPTTGCVLRVDRYRPSEEQRRFLRARDENCRFPGCRRPVMRCEIDHTQASAEGGPTSDDNLAHLCVGHHVMKHASDWSVRQLGHGILEWTSPTGLVYIDRPPALVRFEPATDPPPF